MDAIGPGSSVVAVGVSAPSSLLPPLSRRPDTPVTTTTTTPAFSASSSPYRPFPPAHNSLRVVFGSSTKQGLFHANEDRAGAYYWTCSYAAPLSPTTSVSSSASGTSPHPNASTVLSEQQKQQHQKQQKKQDQQPQTSSSQSSSSSLVSSSPLIAGPAPPPRLLCSTPKPLSLQGVLYTRGHHNPSTPPACPSLPLSPGSLTKSTSCLLTLCDGHDGHSAADFVTKNLAMEMQRALRDVLVEEWEEEETRELERRGQKEKEEKKEDQQEPETRKRLDVKENPSDTTTSSQQVVPVTSSSSPYPLPLLMWHLYHRCWVRAFRRLDDSFHTRVNSIQAISGRPCTSGACVISCLVQGAWVTTAGLGDCRAAALLMIPSDKGSSSSPQQQRGTGTTTASEDGDASTYGRGDSGEDCLGRVGDDVSTVHTLIPSQTTSGIIPQATTLTNITSQLTSSHSSPSSSPSRLSSSSLHPSCSFSFTWLSHGHRCSSPTEISRIRSLGGSVQNSRLGGVLEPSRSIGDFDIKESQPEGVLSCLPETATVNMEKGGIVILGTDGMWDFVGEDQVIPMVCRAWRRWIFRAAKAKNIRRTAAAAAVGMATTSATVAGEHTTKSGDAGVVDETSSSAEEGADGCEPSSADLCKVATRLVTAARKRGSRDDCTVTVIYIAPEGPG
eukprot:GHVS01005031.1.p1 GENE.GHVS01005031.1~~GHVS01005031.1.p1  ORF type:complete len:671 (+),score=185.11 GHVS01005031.1:1191-3203(+)